MIISVIGINHKTAPIEIREKFYLNELQQEFLLSNLKLEVNISEAFVLSTCNRTEIYLHSLKEIDIASIIRMITEVKSLPFQGALSRHFYHLKNEEALHHLFKVTCGLDSQILGEKQILGQVRNALMLAQQKNFFLQPFNILANIVLQTGKKARSETAIDCGGSSISWAAVMKAEKTLGPLCDVKTLVIGAGKMSKLAVGQMVNKGFRELFLMNRTYEHAVHLAEKFSGTVVPFCDIKEILSRVDLCICSSSAPHFILDHETVNKIMPLRGHRRLLFIDISMPRNIDPKISHIEGVTLYSIDDLDSAVERNMKKRQDAVSDVEGIIEGKLKDYYKKTSMIDLEDNVIVWDEPTLSA